MRPHATILTSSHSSRRASLALCASALLLLAGSRAYVPAPLPSEIAARAFVITDPEILAPFTFNRVIEALTVAQSSSWLELLATRGGIEWRRTVMPLNGFIAVSEAGLWWPAGATWSHVRPIAIVNRFDLAPADHSNCGEYRVIFTQRNGSRTRLHIALEAVVPNPHPDRGKAGCTGVAAFWWELAGIDSAATRRDRLEDFFFHSGGIDREGFARAGKIRTSEISDGRPEFAQFEMKRHCDSGQPCVSRLTRVPLDNMPDAALFDATHERAEAFRRDFLRQVASLAIPDVNRYFMRVDRAYSVSNVDTLVPPFNYRLPFRRSLRAPAGLAFRKRIAEELKKAGSDLMPEDIIDRAETQNCAGCHGKPGPVGGGGVFPKAFEQGEHISDESLLQAARLSPALEEVFIPYRIDLLRNYLRSVEIQ